MHSFIQIILLITIALSVNLSTCMNLTIVNNCQETIWPGITATNTTIEGAGFALKPGDSSIYSAPQGWGGRIWGRTGCNFDKNGNGTCQTGACGTTLICTSPGSPPASIAEFTLSDTTFYAVSLVDGFNLPLTITPIQGKGDCSVAGCKTDLRDQCPPELTFLSDGKTVACRSACNVFNSDSYCCKGMYSSPVTCVPTNYSLIFKTACPEAYSYAYDDPTSIITCSTTDFVLSFCSPRNQTQQCSYHDNKLVCSGSERLKSVAYVWAVFMILLPIIIQLRITL
uniref:pathogenesis-related thaumatin-like protein 3.5 n=1 Tax=Erigeron canadensis TaxID=72917 RepID=UPI001CB98CBB|nr:pathogenesis-related thaumatin-like protein 3.5 [Erigeron canadensis]